MTTALLIIDMQRALCAGPEAADGIDTVLVHINQLSRAARRAQFPVVWIQHQETAGTLVAESEGWQLADGLQVESGDLRVRKRTPNSFHGTTLQGLLQQRGVRRLVICGLQTEFCVDTTVRQALSMGYDVVLAADAHSTPGNSVVSAEQIRAHHNFTLGHLQSFDGTMAVTPTADVTF